MILSGHKMILLCQGSRGDNYLRVSVIQEKGDAIFNIGETENVSKYVRTMNQEGKELPLRQLKSHNINTVKDF